jgi:hypothetical protein
MEVEGFWNKTKLAEAYAKAEEALIELKQVVINIFEDKQTLKDKAAYVAELFMQVISNSIYPEFKANSQLGIAETNEVVAYKLQAVSPVTQPDEEEKEEGYVPPTYEEEPSEIELTYEQILAIVGQKEYEACTKLGGVWVPDDQCMDGGMLNFEGSIARSDLEGGYTYDPITGSGVFAWPVTQTQSVISHYGMRGSSFHNGVDIGG